MNGQIPLKAPKLFQEETDILHDPITGKDIEFVVKNLPRKKIPSPNSFTGEFQKTFKIERIPIIHKLFQLDINQRGEKTFQQIP